MFVNPSKTQIFSNRFPVNPSKIVIISNKQKEQAHKKRKIFELLQDTNHPQQTNTR